MQIATVLVAIMIIKLTFNVNVVKKVIIKMFAINVMMEMEISISIFLGVVIPKSV